MTDTEAQDDARKQAGIEYAGDLWNGTVEYFAELKDIGDRPDLPVLRMWADLSESEQRTFVKRTHDGRMDLLAAAMTIGLDR